MFETLSIQRRASKLHAGTFLVCAGLAMAAISLAALPGWLRTMLAAGFLCQLIHHWRNCISLSGQGAWKTVLYDGGGWCLKSPGREVYVTLRPDSIVSECFAILLFQTEDSRVPISVPLLADSADADNLRRLRVIVRYTSKLES